MSPRYDVPKAAPEPLRQVQLFLNSIDLEHEDDWLPGWLAEHGVQQQRLESELARARALREALRALALANNGVAVPETALAVVNEAAAALALHVDAGRRVAISGDGNAVDEVLACALRAMLDGSWSRLKACRNCRWSFYDYSPNRSAAWCSMQLCGNRAKTRAYRRRKVS